MTATPTPLTNPTVSPARGWCRWDWPCLQRITGQLLLLVLLVALPLSAVIAYLVFSEATQARQQAVAQVQATAHAMAEDSQAFLERNREQLSYLAARPAVRALDPAACDPLITELQRISSLYSVILLADAQGRMVCQSLASSGDAPFYADREWFQSAIRSSGFRANAPIVGRLTGTLVIPLTLPVQNLQGVTVGVLMFAASLSEISRLVARSVNLPPGSLITVVGGDGSIIARSPDPDKWLGKQARLIPTLAHQLAHREGVDTAPGADGVIRVFGFTTLDRVDWLIAVGVPLAAVEAPYRAQLKQSLGIVSVVLVAVLLLSLYLAKMIRTPIASLAQAARRAAKGELGVPALERGPVEIADVAREFNRMLARRAQAEAELTLRNAQLEAANKELDAFAYSASHDLRAPLQTIDGFSRALLEDYGDKLDPEASDFLQRIRRASQLMAQLVDDLLKLSRLSRADVDFEPVDLHAIAAAVAERLRAREPNRQLAFHNTPHATAYGDTRLLTALMENLLGNAWKFTSRHAQATVEFGVLEQNGDLVYFVRDDGAGFDMARVNKLFTPFQRLHATSEFPGTGIGLALVRRIVLRHGGRVWAEGSPEKGATIYFTLTQRPTGIPAAETGGT